MSDNIPFEVQAEIMKRLPTKSLMQFRSVSKAWKSLIDSRKFIVDYSIVNTQQHHVMVSYVDRKRHQIKFVSAVDDVTYPQHKVSLKAPIGGGHPRIIPSVIGVSQGLFCLSRGNNPHPSSLVIWNPSIRKSVAISMVEMLGYGYECFIGFGVCPHTNDPKLLRIKYLHSMSYLDTNDTRTYPWEVQVYALSSGAWRTIPTVRRPRNTIVLAWPQVVIDEFIYWVAFDKSIVPEYQSCNLIMSFDMTREELAEVPLPDSVAHARKYNVRLSKLNGSLVALVKVRAEKVVFDVWKMERGGPNSFTKLYTINAPHPYGPYLFGFRKNNEPIFSANTSFKGGDDHVFVHELHVSDDISYVGVQERAFPYMETLLLLDH